MEGLPHHVVRIRAQVVLILHDILPFCGWYHCTCVSAAVIDRVIGGPFECTLSSYCTRKIGQVPSKEKHGPDGFGSRKGLYLTDLYLNVEGSRVNIGVLVTFADWLEVFVLIIGTSWILFGSSAGTKAVSSWNLRSERKSHRNPLMDRIKVVRYVLLLVLGVVTAVWSHLQTYFMEADTGVRFANTVSERRADFVAQIESMLVILSSCECWCMMKVWTWHTICTKAWKVNHIMIEVTLDHVSFCQRSHFHIYLH